LDTEDFSGSLRKIFDDSLAFIMRNLRKVQAGQGVNSPGLPEIPPSVFEELLVNALIHRDYFVNATIRLFIFDNRIEIISPGHLPNNLTVEKIRSGISNIRNPILVSYVAKGLLPYKGLGSGIKRALEEWPDISFVDDREGCMFIATVHRKELKVTGAVEKRLTKGSQKGSQKSSQKSSQKIIEFMRNDPTITIADLALRVGITDRAIKKQIEKLKAQDRIRRIGPDKGGRWQVTE
jgi:ATP-dependent DNA helicase RecG